MEYCAYGVEDRDGNNDSYFCPIDYGGEIQAYEAARERAREVFGWLIRYTFTLDDSEGIEDYRHLKIDNSVQEYSG